MPLTKTTMETADAHGRTRPTQEALDAANEIAELLGNPLIADAMVLVFADIIDKAHCRMEGLIP